jgi:transglutaminase-like putative cysteine protease
MLCVGESHRRITELDGAAMTILTVRHITNYRYKRPVSFGEHWIMSRPRESHDQRLLDLKLEITPKPAHLRWIRDVFGNHVAVARFAGCAEALRFDSTVRVDHCPAEIVETDIEDFARACPFVYDAGDRPDLVHFIERQFPDPHRQLKLWARSFLRQDGSTGTHALLVNLTRTIRQTFTYVARHEKGIQDPLLTLKLGSGSCRDLAMLMIEAVRSLGMAARFVSGYLHVPCHNDDGHAGGGNTHAWVQVYLPGPGWVDFDPASGVVGNRDLVRVAVVRDPRQAIPLHGSWTGFPSDNLGMSVEVNVTAGHAGTDRSRADTERRGTNLSIPA